MFSPPTQMDDNEDYFSSSTSPTSFRTPSISAYQSSPSDVIRPRLKPAVFPTLQSNTFSNASHRLDIIRSATAEELAMSGNPAYRDLTMKNFELKAEAACLEKYNQKIENLFRSMQASLMTVQTSATSASSSISSMGLAAHQRLPPLDYVFPRLDRSMECPNIRFFSHSEWAEYIQKKKNSSEKLPRTLGFLQSETLDPVTSIYRADDSSFMKHVYETAKQIFGFFFWLDLDPDTWGRATAPVAEYFHKKMASEYPEFRWCDDGKWKAQVYATTKYPDWCKDTRERGLERDPGITVTRAERRQIKSEQNSEPPRKRTKHRHRNSETRDASKHTPSVHGSSDAPPAAAAAPASITETNLTSNTTEWDIQINRTSVTSNNDEGDLSAGSGPVEQLALESPKTSSHDTELLEAQDVNPTIASTSGTKPGDKTTAENDVDVAKIVEPATNAAEHLATAAPKAKPGPAPVRARRMVNPLASTRVPHTVPIPNKSEFSTAPATATKAGNRIRPLAKDLPMVLAADCAITGRNLFAADYLKTNSPTVGEFTQIWQNLSKEQAKVWESRAREAKRSSKDSGNASLPAASTNPASETEKENMAVG